MSVFVAEAARPTLRLTAHPDTAPFHHDLYRGVGRGRFWVMGRQSGPMNWVPYNPIPAPGMIVSRGVV
jgi:beta-galactosidase